MVNINKEKFSDASIEQNLGLSGKAQVDLFNGNLTFVHTDVQYNYGNPIISVGHVYSTKSQSTGVYGNNWSLNCDEKVEIASDGSYLKYSDASGSTAYYYPFRNGVNRKFLGDDNIFWADTYFTSPSNPTGGFAVKLEYSSCTMYDEKFNYKCFDNLVLSEDGTVYTSPLTSVKNSDGNSLYFGRNEDNTLSYVEDDFLRGVYFIYENGKLTKITDTAGREVTYTYASGNIVEINSTTGGITRITYNADNCITEIMNNMGVSYRYTYDGDGRVQTVTKASLYDKIASGYESEENEQTYESTTINYGNTTSHKEATPDEDDYEVLKEMSKNDNPTTFISTNAGVYYVYHFKTENKLFYFNGMSYESDKIVYVNEGNTTYKMGIAKNTIHFKTALNGESIDVQTCKNNLLNNAFFDNTQMDENGYVTPESWDISPLNSSMISYTSLDNSTALLIPDNGTEYTVSQTVENVVETDSMGNTYNKLNSGMYTVVGWVKTIGDFDKRELSLQLVYGDNNVEEVTLNDYEIVASINNWHCILRTVYIKDTKEFNYEEQRLNKVIVKIKYKGFGVSNGMLVDRVSLTAQQTTISESEVRILALDSLRDVQNTYTFDDIDMEATREEVGGIPADFKFTAPWLINAVIKYPSQEQEEDSNVSDDAYNIPITFKDGNRYYVFNLEVQLGAVVRKADANYITESTMDNMNNPVLHKLWSREKDQTCAFETVKSYDNYCRETSVRDFRDVETSTVYDDTITKPKKTVSTYYSGNYTTGPWIRNITTYFAQKEGVLKEQGENRTYTEYTYNSGNGDEDFVKDKLYKVKYENNSYTKYTYDANGNVATLVIGKNDVEHSYTYEYTYGLMTKVTTDSGDVFTYDYDGLGQTISIKHNGVELVSHTYVYNYGAGFLPYKITVKFGKKYRTQFDAYSNPTEIYEYTNVNATTAADEILKIKMTYDDRTGECVEIKDYTNSSQANTPATVITTANDNGKITFESTGETNYSYSKRYKKELLQEEEKSINGDTTYMVVEYDEDETKGVCPDNRLMRSIITNDSSGEDILLDETFGYDNLGRLETTTVKASDSSENTNTLYTKTNVYRVTSNKTGDFIQDQTYVIPNSQYGEITRTTRTIYDSLGNVASHTMTTNDNYPYETLVFDGGSSVSTKPETIQYTYDENGKVVRENNMKADYSTFKYEYDTEGNITKKSVYKFTALATPPTLKEEFIYTYDTQGRLTGYGNKVIGNYDSNGNPRLYKGSTLIWNGSRLTEMAGCVFTYDGKGYRTSKYVSTTNNTHKYTYDEEGNLLAEKITDANNDSTVINYIYGAQGVVGFKLIKTYYDENEEHSFYYIKDILGNIRQIVDKDGSLVVSYYYDAWGNIYPQYHSYVLTFAGETLTAEDVSNLNGLFYKGYYYDKENKLYYLITRYYDPEVGRFISPDDPQYLDFEVAYGYNRYAYCNNNPVMGYDPEGNWWKNVLKITAAVAICGALVVASFFTCGAASVIIAGAAIGATAGMVTSGITGGIESAAKGESFWDGFADGTLSGAVSGAVSGAIAASPLGTIGQIGANALISTINYFATAEEPSVKGFLNAAAIGALAGLVGGKGWLSKGSTLATDIVLNGIETSFAKVAGKGIVEFANPIIKSTLVSVANLADEVNKFGEHIKDVIGIWY